MKSFGLSVVFGLVLVASAAHAGYTPVTGSCVPEGAQGDWVRCQLRDDVTGQITSGYLPRNVVKCYQMQGYENDPTCLYPPRRGYCIFRNPAYAGAYRTEVETANGVPTIEAACGNVLVCINGPACTRADAPAPRGGWVLEQAVTYAH